MAFDYTRADELLQHYRTRMGAPAGEDKGVLRNLPQLGAMAGAQLGKGIYGMAEYAGSAMDDPDLTQFGAEARRSLNDFYMERFSELSPNMQEAMQREFATLGADAAWRSWESIAGQAIVNSAYILPSILSGGLAAAGTGFAARLLGLSGLGVEGVLAGGAMYGEIADEVERFSEKELREQSPRYNELREELTDAQARDVLIRESGDAIVPYVAGATVAGGALGGRVARAAATRTPGLRYLTREAPGMVGRTVRGGIQEFGQEAVQSGGEAVLGNIAAGVYDPERAMTEGLLENVLAGGITGGALGAGVGPLMGPRPWQPQAAATTSTDLTTDEETPSTEGVADAIQSRSETPPPDQRGTYRQTRPRPVPTQLELGLEETGEPRMPLAVPVDERTLPVPYDEGFARRQEAGQPRQLPLPLQQGIPQPGTAQLGLDLGLEPVTVTSPEQAPGISQLPEEGGQYALLQPDVQTAYRQPGPPLPPPRQETLGPLPPYEPPMQLTPEQEAFEQTFAEGVQRGVQARDESLQRAREAQALLQDAAERRRARETAQWFEDYEARTRREPPEPEPPPGRLAGMSKRTGQLFNTLTNALSSAHRETYGERMVDASPYQRHVQAMLRLPHTRDRAAYIAEQAEAATEPPARRFWNRAYRNLTGQTSPVLPLRPTRRTTKEDRPSGEALKRFQQRTRDTEAERVRHARRDRLAEAQKAAERRYGKGPVSRLVTLLLPQLPGQTVYRGAWAEVVEDEQLGTTSTTAGKSESGAGPRREPGVPFHQEHGRVFEAILNAIRTMQALTNNLFLLSSVQMRLSAKGTLKAGYKKRKDMLERNLRSISALLDAMDRFKSAEFPEADAANLVQRFFQAGAALDEISPKFMEALYAVSPRDPRTLVSRMERVVKPLIRQGVSTIERLENLILNIENEKTRITFDKQYSSQMQGGFTEDTGFQMIAAELANWGKEYPELTDQELKEMHKELREDVRNRVARRHPPRKPLSMEARRIAIGTAAADIAARRGLIDETADISDQPVTRQTRGKPSGAGVVDVAAGRGVFDETPEIPMPEGAEGEVAEGKAREAAEEGEETKRKPRRKPEKTQEQQEREEARRVLAEGVRVAAPMAAQYRADGSFKDELTELAQVLGMDNLDELLEHVDDYRARRAEEAATGGGTGAGTAGRRTGAARPDTTNVRPVGGTSQERSTGLRVADEGSVPGAPDAVAERPYAAVAFEHQREAANLILKRFNDGHHAFMLADGPGAGKTIEQLMVADTWREKTDKPITIVTGSKAIFENYKDDAELLGIDLNERKIELVTYNDVAAGLVPLKNDRALLILDEAHNLKNAIGPDASDKAVIGRKLQAAHVLYATATPLDRYSGAAYFLSAVTGMSEAEVFERIGFKLTTHTDGTVSLTPLRGTGIVEQHQAMMLLRQELVSQGAWLRRALIPKAEFKQEFDSMTPPDELQLKIADIQDFWSGRRGKAQANSHNEQRRLAELYKVPSAIKLAIREHKAGRRVVIMVETIAGASKPLTFQGLKNEQHLGTGRQIYEALQKEGLRVALAGGPGVTQTTKKNMVRRFQEGELDVIISTPGSAGTGVNLDDQVGDAPRSMIITSLPEGGDTLQQVLGRVDRLKTVGTPFVYPMMYSQEVEVENRIRATVGNKLATLRAVQGGEDIDVAAGLLTDLPEGGAPSTSGPQPRAAPAATTSEPEAPRSGTPSLEDQLRAAGLDRRVNTLPYEFIDLPDHPKYGARVGLRLHEGETVMDEAAVKQWLDLMNALAYMVSGKKPYWDFNTNAISFWGNQREKAKATLEGLLSHTRNIPAPDNTDVVKLEHSRDNAIRQRLSTKQRRAITELRDLVRAGASPNDFDEAARLLLRALPVYDPRRLVVKAIAKLHLKYPIVTADLGKHDGEFFNRWESGDLDGTEYKRFSMGAVRLNEKVVEDYPAGTFIHVLLHEMVHGAIHHTMVTNPKFAARIAGLHERLIKSGKLTGGYWTTSPNEFITEAMSNSALQRELQDLPADAILSRSRKGSWVRQAGRAVKSVWQRFVNLVLNALNLPPQVRYQSMMEQLLRVFQEEAAPMPMQRQWVPAANVRVGKQISIREQQPLERAMMSVMDPRTASLAADTMNLTERLLFRTTGIELNIGTDKWRAMLPLMTRRQIGQTFEKLFATTRDNPLTRYVNLNARRWMRVRQLQIAPEAYTKEWLNLKAKNPEMERRLSDLLLADTVWEIWSDRPLKDPRNAHLDDAGKKKYRQHRAMYNKLDDETRKLLHELRGWFDMEWNSKVNQLTSNILRAYKVPESDVVKRAIKPPTSRKKEDFDAWAKALTAEAEKHIKTAAGKAHPQAVKDFVEDIDEVNRRAKLQGPYFPLKRYGEYAVDAVNKETIELASQEAFDKKRHELWLEDPGTEIKWAKRSGDGGFAEITRRYFSLHESRLEAEDVRKQLLDTGDWQVVNKVTLKRDYTLEREDVSPQFLKKLESRGLSETNLNAIRAVLIELMPDTSIRKHELKRTGRAGYSREAMRSFAAYSKASAYWRSQLEYGHKLATALEEMAAVPRGTSVSSDDAIKAELVVRELRKKDQNAAEQFNREDIVMKATGNLSNVGFLWYLASFSYLTVNLTQPFLIGMPYLAARYGAIDTNDAMRRTLQAVLPESWSQTKRGWRKLVLNEKDVLEAIGTDALDIKSLVDRTKMFTPTEKAGLHDMLETLANRGLLTLTFAEDLRDAAEPGRSALGRGFGKTMDIARFLPHQVEIINRSIMAMAAYRLEMDKSGNQEKAVRAADDAVAMTQFDYSGPNKPRLFQSPWLRPVLMFKQHGQHMYYLLIREAYRAASSKEERKEALLTLAGIFGMHAAAAGALGAVFEPVKWALGAVFWLYSGLSDEDEPLDYEEMVRRGLAQAFGATAGEAIARGLPRLAGLDWSNRLSLDNMMFMDSGQEREGREWIMQKIYELGGPMVAAVGNAAEGVKDISEGAALQGWARIMPKGLRDMMTAYRLLDEGMVDSRGNVIHDSKNLDPMDIFFQAWGFTPAEVAEVYEGRAAVKGAEAYATKRRQTLIERYRRASSADRQELWRDEIARFNRSWPSYKITRGTLVRSMQAKRKREREAARRGGVFLDRKHRQLYERGAFANI